MPDQRKLKTKARKLQNFIAMGILLLKIFTNANIATAALV